MFELCKYISLFVQAEKMFQLEIGLCRLRWNMDGKKVEVFAYHYAMIRENIYSGLYFD